MAVQSQEPTSNSQSWEADDEIDLRKYAGVLVRRWKEVVLVAVLAVLLAAAGVLFLRATSIPLYAATAGAAIVRTQTDVNLDERFTTSSDAPAQADVGSRRAALLGLVASSRIAEQVIAELGDMLSPEEQNPAELLPLVEGSIAPVAGRTTPSDLIDISVTADSPEKAAAIANAWAKYYVQEVNHIYGQVPDEMMTSVDAELARASVAYETAQKGMETFLAASPLAALTRQVEEQQATVTKMREMRTTALQTYSDQVIASYKRIIDSILKSQTDGQLLAFDKEQEGRLARLRAFLDSYNLGQAENLTAQTDRDLALSRQLYDRWLRVNSYLTAARTLQEQVAVGGRAAVASTSQALQLLKLQIVASTDDRPLTMGDLYYGKQSQSTAQDTFIIPRLLVPQEGISTNAPGFQMSLLPQERATGAGQQPTFQFQIAGKSAPTEVELKQDVEATVRSLESELTALETEIAQLSSALAMGERMTDTLRTPAAVAAQLDAFRSEYPQFFQPGPLATLGSQVAFSSTLASAAQEQATALMELSSARLLPMDNPNAPLQTTIDKLEDNIRSLQAQIEAETARNRQFAKQRDQAWDSFSTLNSKQAELRLARAAANSEVRFGYPAVPPLDPEEGPSLILTVGLALVVGLLVGILVAFVREYVGRPPLGSRPTPTS